MTMQKIGDAEGKLEVLRGHEAQALDRLEARFGKRLHEFDDDERKELHKILGEAQKQNEEDSKVALSDKPTAPPDNASNKSA